MQRVDDVTSPEYRTWLSEVDAIRWGVDSIIDVLKSNLSAAQKTAVLKGFFDVVPELGATERGKLQDQLATATLADSFDPDLGDTVGRLLRMISSDEELRALENMYWELDEQLEVGNKAAIVDASKNSDFVVSVLNDSTQPLGVREEAVERASELGSRAPLEELVAPGAQADPMLQFTALRSLGESAEDQASLQKVLDAAATHDKTDSEGRETFAAARIGVSESGVFGKSALLFADWKSRLEGAPEQTEADFVRSLLVGKTFARALLSDADVQGVSRYIDAGLRPLIAEVLAAPPVPSSRRLQMLAELATDLKTECEMRPAEVCSDSRDPRMRMAGELVSALLPRLAGTELEYYRAALQGR
jgi:hypothetical protein